MPRFNVPPEIHHLATLKERDKVKSLLERLTKRFDNESAINASELLYSIKFLLDYTETLEQRIDKLESPGDPTSRPALPAPFTNP